METLGILGFVLLLTGWFGMFLRVRRDHPGHPLTRYGNYIGPRLFGFRFRKRSDLSLVRFYWQHYGADGWFWVWGIGIALILVAIIAWGT